MKNVKAILNKTKNATYNNPVPLYINFETDTLYTTDGEDRFFLTNLIRENTREELIKTVNRCLSM